MPLNAICRHKKLIASNAVMKRRRLSDSDSSETWSTESSAADTHDRRGHLAAGARPSVPQGVPIYAVLSSWRILT